MSHQDWTPVIFNKPKYILKKEQISNKQNNLKPQVIMTQRDRNLDSSEVDAPPKINMELKKAIQKARQAKKLTQKDLAQLVGVHQSEITNYENGKAIPYFCFQPSDENPDGDVFLFAGLYNDIDDNTLSTTILTTDANDFFMDVHNKGKRMPLVLDPHYFEDWLDEGLSIPEVNELMAVGMTNKPFSAHPVSSDLYKRNVDTNKPYIIQPVQKDTLF